MEGNIEYKGCSLATKNMPAATSVSLVRVTAERVKVMFVAADAYPKEAPVKGWL